MCEKERWRWIKGYEGLYMVSDQGRVLSIPKVTRPDGVIMSQQVGRNGYATVKLRTKDNASKRVSVHRLVAQAFIPNPKDKPEVNHKDGIKTNNSVSNLEWVTTSENKRHSVRVLGNKPPVCKSRPWLRKLTDEQAREIRTSNMPVTKLAREYGVTLRVIQAIKKGETYKEVI